MKVQKYKFKSFRKFILQVLKDGLSEKLHYHTVDHILDVEKAAVNIARESGIHLDQLPLLRTAVLIHDIGFIYNYSGHEDLSCEYAQENLPEYGYTDKEIKSICGMIEATKIPQKPKNLLEKVIADADLDYLGREDYGPISNNLYKELKNYGLLKSDEEWLQLQIDFLRQHRYHTEWSKLHRSPKKQEVLKKLEAQLAE